MSYVVAIDPGHGASDTGATGQYTHESVYVLAFAQDLARDVIERWSDVDVILTREDDREDPPLSQRHVRAQDAGAQLVISLHANDSENDDQGGALALYWPGNPVGVEVAAAAARAFPLPLLRRGGAWPADAARWPRANRVLRSFAATTVLLELGYLDRPADEEAMNNPHIRDGLLFAAMTAVARWRYLVTRGDS